MALLPVADALACVLADAAALGREHVPLEAAHRRVLAQDLAAARTQPPQAMSAMDGYAVRAADAARAPARLRVIGEVAAGRPPDQAVGPGEAMRIFTGGVVPDGADAVVIQENTERDGDIVIVQQPAQSGRHIRAAGADFHEGDVLLHDGRVLSARDLALAAAMNRPTVPVNRRPRVALLATGDELVRPGETIGPGQIVMSNGYALAALAAAEGAEVIDLGIARDTLDATQAAIRHARDGHADVLVTTGGASVGDHDLILPALRAEGFDLDFWKIAMRPGKPMMFGRSGGLRAIGLPGNPVSSFVCATLFLVPLIRALSGRRDAAHVTEPALLGSALPANDQRADYLRASLARDGRALIATPFGKQDSSFLAVLANAEALIVRPPHAPAADAGSACEIIRLPG